MNQTCQLMGHAWGRWKWRSSWGDRRQNGVSFGPGHEEVRECERFGCWQSESRELPGQWGGMTPEEYRNVQQDLAEDRAERRALNRALRGDG